MILTLELTPMEEAMLATAAEKQGVPPTELAKQFVVKNLLQSEPTNGRIPDTASVNMTEEDRVAVIDAIVGKYAHLPGTGTDDLHRERQKDKEREENINTRPRTWVWEGLK